MNNQRDLLAIGSALPADAANEIDFLPPSDGTPARYFATVVDSDLRKTAGYGPTRADALQEAVNRYLTSNWNGVGPETAPA